MAASLVRGGGEERLVPVLSAPLTHGKGDEYGEGRDADAADGGTGASSFQNWIMYSVIKLLPSVREGVHVREIPLLQIPSIVTF